MVAQIFLYVKTFFAKSEDFFMQRTNTEIAESIRALAKARGVTIKQTLADCKINRNFIYDKITRIADYFGVSTAALLAGETERGESGDLHAFLELYRRLSDADRAELRAYMRKLLENGD